MVGIEENTRHAEGGTRKEKRWRIVSIGSNGRFMYSRMKHFCSLTAKLTAIGNFYEIKPDSSSCSRRHSTLLRGLLELHNKPRSLFALNSQWRELPRLAACSLFIGGWPKIITTIGWRCNGRIPLQLCSIVFTNDTDSSPIKVLDDE